MLLLRNKTQGISFYIYYFSFQIANKNISERITELHNPIHTCVSHGNQFISLLRNEETICQCVPGYRGVCLGCNH